MRHSASSGYRPKAGDVVVYGLRLGAFPSAAHVAIVTGASPGRAGPDVINGDGDRTGFSVVEILSECVEFYEGAFDAGNPRKGGAFNEVPADHDVTDEHAAYKLADAQDPGAFGIFYSVKRPTKNANEAGLVADHAALRHPPLPLARSVIHLALNRSIPSGA